MPALVVGVAQPELQASESPASAMVKVRRRMTREAYHLGDGSPVQWIGTKLRSPRTDHLIHFQASFDFQAAGTKNLCSPLDPGPHLSSLRAPQQLCSITQEKQLPWYERRNLRLAPRAWPLVAFGPASAFFFLMTLGVFGFLFLLALSFGGGGIVFAVLAPIVALMGIYPGFCWAWTRMSNVRDAGLRIELVPAIPETQAHDPYRALDKPSSYRIWYRGKVIEQGPITAGSLALRTYYFRPDSPNAAPDYVTSLVLKSKATKAPVWWFAFARHFEDNAYVLVTRSKPGSAELCKQANALSLRLGLPEGSIPQVYEYASPQAEQLVQKARALAEPKTPNRVLT